MTKVSVAVLGYALASVVLISGCGSTEADFRRVEPNVKVVEKHHHHHGPHDGHLIELGDEAYHAELVLDEKTKKITVYILGSDPDEAHAISEESITLELMIDKSETEFQLTAAPQENDPEGSSSRFELADNAQIAAHIGDDEELEGHMSVTIQGKQYTGEIGHDYEADNDE